jgi:hypothetical protein
VQPACAGFAAEHAFSGGPVFRGRVGEVVQVSRFGGGEGLVAAHEGGDHVFHVFDDGADEEGRGGLEMYKWIEIWGCIQWDEAMRWEGEEKSVGVFGGGGLTGEREAGLDLILNPLCTDIKRWTGVRSKRMLAYEQSEKKRTPATGSPERSQTNPRRFSSHDKNEVDTPTGKQSRDTVMQ